MIASTVQRTRRWSRLAATDSRSAVSPQLQPDVDEECGAGMQDETKVLLSDVLTRKGAQLTYVYDFGDDWQHRVIVEDVIDAKPGTDYPIFIDGARTAPPEDVGGVWGYEDFLEAIKDPGATTYGMDYMPYLLCGDQAVYFAGSQCAKLIALAARDGKLLSFLFLRYLSDNYETAAQKELGPDYPKLETADRRTPLAVWYARIASSPVSSPCAPAAGCNVTAGRPATSASDSCSPHSSSSIPCTAGSG